MSLFQKCVTYERQEEELFKRANSGEKISNECTFERFRKDLDSVLVTLIVREILYVGTQAN